jgi:hypothetical protein
VNVFLWEPLVKVTAWVATKTLVLSLVLASSAALAQEGDGGGRWPGAGHLGLRAGIGGSTATPGIDVGNVGIKYLATDKIAVSADLGLRIAASNSSSFADFAVDVAASFYLGDTGKNLRPYIPLVVGLGVVGQSNNFGGRGAGTFQLAFGGGVGAEYWFSQNFSIAADLVLRVGFANFNPLVVEIATLTPGVHATFYF